MIMRCTNRALAKATFLLFAITATFVVENAHAQGVAVTDAVTAEHLQLVNNEVDVVIENQVAIVTTVQTFRNSFPDARVVNYAFPMPDGASATTLRWSVNGEWKSAVFSPTPQDPTLGGDGADPDAQLMAHLGSNPLYFEVDDAVRSDSLLSVELTYVQLLPYSFGQVHFRYPNDYSLIDSRPIEHQKLRVSLTSPRTVESFELSSHVPGQLSNDGTTASLAYEAYEAPAVLDYRVRYSLSLSELGLFGFSTLLADSAVADSGVRGFFAFVIEPDPSESTDAIEKAFTLIIDRSGSMSGDKIVQARGAASFVVNNLNDGDVFNIVDFSTRTESFRPGLVEYNLETRDQALDYIQTLAANGNTNISDAFNTAILQASGVDSSKANIIVFFTDGIPTTGLTNTDQILASIQSATTTAKTNPIIFPFGIGQDVNRQLLALIATRNDGIVQFLDDDELEERISDFYLQIRNPVVLGAQIAFQPPVIVDYHPNPMPGLFKGQQVTIAGRYNEAVSTQIELTGTAYGRPVSYTYTFALSDSTVDSAQFLTKVWAKLKISDLLVQYYLAPEGSAQADGIRDAIVDLSVSFGVISPFSSFRTNDDQSIGTEGDEDYADDLQHPISLQGNYPNPFVAGTTINLEVHVRSGSIALVRIYDTLGRLIRVIPVAIAGPGAYSVFWDGTDSSGARAPAGLYVYTVSVDNAVVAGTMVKGR